MDLPKKFLAQDLISLGPLQWKALFLPIDKRLMDIQWRIFEQLDSTNKALAAIVKKTSVADLYDLLSKHDYLDSIDAHYREILPILSNNYKILSSFLDTYNARGVELKNVSLRLQEKLSNPKFLN